jgi:predicted Zn-dependent protease
MADDSSIEALRRRVHQDPASIAFAQLGEELRRAGHFAEAVRVCQTGLAFYPEYLSARVTLGRSLLELGRIDEAERELETVLVTSPEHVAATRALADLRHRRLVDEGERRRTARILATLEAWLAAIDVTRAHRHA